MINRELLHTGLLALFGCTAGFASIVTTPAGLAPGTQYQLAFITSGQSFATSTNIADYNAFVTAQAALDPTLAAFDTANSVTWTAIGSTQSVNATANAPSTGLVYILNGTKIASGTNTLYSGTLLSALDIDENGNPGVSTVWTGSNSAGTASGGINDLGQTFTEYGNSSLTTGGWIASTNGVESNNNMPLYALSSVITVPQVAGTPEPATFALVPGALVLLFGLRRFRSQQLPAKSR